MSDIFFTGVIILVFIVAFFFGYQFCKIRWNVKGLLLSLKTVNSLLMGEITHDEALETMEKIQKGEI